jgi:hypothetical protein
MPTAPGLESEWATSPSPIAIRRRLRLALPPAPLTSLLGRDADVAAASSLLTRRETRLLTWLGLGGVGKTRLALQVATACSPEFDDQVAWAPIATAATPESMPMTLVRAVGVADAGTGRVTEALDAAPLFSDLLLSCPDLSLLVTSWALLRITGERPLDVLPLATGPDHAGPDGSRETALLARMERRLPQLTAGQRDLPRAQASSQELVSMGWDRRWPVFAYLEDLADIAGGVGQPETAARLYGAADAQREQFDLPLEPRCRAEYDRDVDVAYRAIGKAAFGATREAGHALEPEQAVAEALVLSLLPPSSPRPLLSHRELEVLRLLAGGLSDREIADALSVVEAGLVDLQVGEVLLGREVRPRPPAVAAPAQCLL